MTISFLNFFTLASGLAFAIWRFGLKRERFSFLNLAIDAKIITGEGEVKLVSIVIRLENKGETKIIARGKRKKTYLYPFESDDSDNHDQCRHAGTLKIRSVPFENESLTFDWYSLKPLELKISKGEDDSRVKTVNDNFEQINYLSEYQDPNANYEEVDFWIEPKETYVFEVPVWLQPGIYSAKAFFLGESKKYRDDDYWSQVIIFQVPG